MLEDQKHFVTFENHSRIVSLPCDEERIRGFSGPTLVIIDEASRVPDDIYHAILPMVAVSHGMIILLSTPRGKRGFFYDECMDAGSDLQLTVTVDDCPRVDRTWLQTIERRMPPRWFRQEFYCEFLEVDDALLTWERIESSMIDGDAFFDAGNLIDGPTFAEGR